MVKKRRDPALPAERHETVRRQITAVITGQNLSAREISSLVSASEKEVYIHLEHIQRSASKKTFSMSVTPAQCRKCGFVFRKRERLKKPGKCPVCHGESIADPLFLITGPGRNRDV